MGDGVVKFALGSGAITVDGARIEVADIEAANGIIHVIDRVLPARSAAKTAAAESSTGAAEGATSASAHRVRQAAAVLELAIERGVPRFNAGDAASCAALYELAITSVVLLGDDAVSSGVKVYLAEALKTASDHQDAADRSWIYRRAMDRALDRMAELMKPTS
jgi:hypothetical protein